MPALGRRRPWHRTPGSAAVRRRHTLVVDLPAAPGSPHRPAPLALPLAPGRPAWQLPGDATASAGLAVLLATLDLAPPGTVVALVGNDPAPALLAAVYSTRLVRAVAADALVAHAARQAAASNALPLVVEERRLGGADGASLDEYATTTGLEPAVVHLGPGVDPGAVLADAADTLAVHRPWVVVTGRRRRSPAVAAMPSSVAHSYQMLTDRSVAERDGVYVLAPDDPPAGFGGRVRAWAQVWTSVGAAAPSPVGPAAAVAVLDLRGANEPARRG